MHRPHARDPGTWRPGGGSRRIVALQVIGTLATAAIVVPVLLVAGRPVMVARALIGAGLAAWWPHAG